MESFFAALKTERVHEARFRTRAEARTAGVVRALGWIVGITTSSVEQPWQAAQSAKHRPQSPNEPDPNNVPLPNT